MTKLGTIKKAGKAWFVSIIGRKFIICFKICQRIKCWYNSYWTFTWCGKGSHKDTFKKEKFHIRSENIIIGKYHCKPIEYLHFVNHTKKKKSIDYIFCIELLLKNGSILIIPNKKSRWSRPISNIHFEAQYSWFKGIAVW